MRTHRTPALAALGTSLALLTASAGPGVAAPEDPRAEAYEEAVLALERALTLVAARDGVEAAEALAGGELPPSLREALAAVHASPGARDLRAFGGQTELQGSLVPGLLDETSQARATLEEVARHAGALMAQELARLEADCRRLQGAGASLLQAGRAGEVASRLAAQELEAGRALLLLAHHAPLLRARLAAATSLAERYEALVRELDRPADPLVRLVLEATPRALERARPELRAVGAEVAVEQVHGQVRRRVTSAGEALEQAIERAVEALRHVRDEELNRVVRGQRGALLAEAVHLHAAYKEQFGSPPDLVATPWWNVYGDRSDARLYFWLEGEERWVQGSERVDPLEPVIDALLDAREPALRAQVCQARALARLYLTFEEPFADGVARLEALAARAAARQEAVLAAARAAGLGEEAAREALVRRTGAALGPLLSGAAAEAPARLRDHLLSTVVTRGGEAGRDLVAVLERVTRELEGLAAWGGAVRLDGPAGARVDLVWSPDPGAGGGWLVAPPREVTLREGGLEVPFVRLAPAEGSPEAAHLRAFAVEGGRTLQGQAALAPGGDRVRELTLAPGDGPWLLVRPQASGGRLRVLQLPRATPPLDLHLETERGRRPLAPALGGGAWIDPAPGEPGGPARVVGLDGEGAAVAEAGVELPARAAVILGAPDQPVWRLAPGEQLEGYLLTEAGRRAEAPHEFYVRSATGALVARERGEGGSFSWTANLPPGRYQVTAQGALPAPFALTRRPPQVSAVFDPAAAPALDAVHPGQGFFLRLDAWPTLVAEEVLRVDWTVSGGTRDRQAVTRPVPGAPWLAMRLPVRLGRGAPGERRVVARVHTVRGVLPVEGRFLVREGGVATQLELRTPDGQEVLALPRSGEETLLRSRTGLAEATWLLLGPGGHVRHLAPRYDGQVPVALRPEEPAGPYWVWLAGQTLGGERVHGHMRVTAFDPVPLALAPPRGAERGEQLTFEVPVPEGFRPPYHHRLDGGAWVSGTSFDLAVGATNRHEVVLRDGIGRQAEGTLAFVGAEPAREQGGPRYGVVADVTERRILPLDADVIASYVRNDNLPAGWVVLEPGPLSAPAVRDRMFRLAPYDGPAPAGQRQVAYRSLRFWDGLDARIRRRFAAEGAEPKVAYDVLDSPSPAGEETLDQVVLRHLGEHGAWAFELVEVQLLASGAVADPAAPADEPLRFRRAPKSDSGGGLGLVRVPGPLADLVLRPVLPQRLVLGEEVELLAALAAHPRPLVAGRAYPGGWDALAPRAHHLLELEAELDVEGRPLRVARRRAERGLATLDLVAVLEHLRTERSAEAEGQPRTAERYEVRVAALGAEAQQAELSFTPIPPGRLENQPRDVVLTLRARLTPALAAGDWPAGRARPKPVLVEGVPLLPDPGDLPEVKVEVKATYRRLAPDAWTGLPPEKPSLGDVAVGGAAPPQAPDLATLLNEAAAGLAADDRREAARRDAARLAARRAAELAPTDPRPWALLADAALAAERVPDALDLARWSLRLGPSPRAHVVVAEAALADFDLQAAAAAVAAAEEQEGVTPELEARLATVRSELGK